MEGGMKKVTRFEDLICWQKARQLVNIVYGLTHQGPFSKDFALRNRIQSAAVSAMSNIAEGFTRFHKRDFVRFLDIAQSSVAEVKSLLYVAQDQGYITQEQFREAQRLADETKGVTLGLLRYVKSTAPRKHVAKEPRSQYKTKPEPVAAQYTELPQHFINTLTH